MAGFTQHDIGVCGTSQDLMKIGSLTLCVKGSFEANNNGPDLDRDISVTSIIFAILKKNI